MLHTLTYRCTYCAIYTVTYSYHLLYISTGPLQQAICFVYSVSYIRLIPYISVCTLNQLSLEQVILQGKKMICYCKGYKGSERLCCIEQCAAWTIKDLTSSMCVLASHVPNACWLSTRILNYLLLFHPCGLRLCMLHCSRSTLSDAAQSLCN